jgi:predicted nucleic acid-binding Zn ribbon protein
VRYAVSGEEIEPEDIHRPDSPDSGSADDLSSESQDLSTGQLGLDSVTDSEDLAADALRSARAIATGRGGGRPARLLRRRNRGRGREGGGYSGARPDDRDPAPIGRIVGNSMVELGWVVPLAEARLMSQWASVVGPEIAARCQPMSLLDGELKISAESTAWATQLRLMAPQILARIASELPAGLVRKLVITGPSSPSWKHGPWSMRGGRGARDTYG